MNTIEPAPKRSSSATLWRWLAAIAGACVLVTAVSIWNLVTLSRDAAALRRELFSALPISARPQVQISVGPVLLTTARGLLSFVDDVPPEARQALRAIKAASVGVYRLDRNLEPSARVQLLAAADRAMDRRDWTRIVAVQKDDETVLVYMPADLAEGDPLRVCLAICAKDQLVLVSAAGDGVELLALAQMQHPLIKL
jgi:hypothetical protein